MCDKRLRGWLSACRCLPHRVQEGIPRGLALPAPTLHWARTVWATSDRSPVILSRPLEKARSFCRALARAADLKPGQRVALKPGQRVALLGEKPGQRVALNEPTS